MPAEHPEGLRRNKGFHPILEREHPYIFIDACMQAWPDADFANAHRHGATAMSITAFMPHDELPAALENLMYWHLVARKHPNTLVATSADDIRAAKRDGRVAFILHAQDGDFINQKLHRLEAFYRLGLRMILFAYNASNSIADGTLDRTSSGLTRFGQLVVEECNRLGMVIDCTHIGKNATLQIIDKSADPVVFTHSNPNAIAPNPRNIDDDQILACAGRGGVIALAPFGPLVLKPGQQTWPSVDDFLDHVDHVAQLTGGTAAIGIGTDMSIGTYPLHGHDPWGEPDYPDVGGEYARWVCGDSRSPMRALSDFNTYAQVWTLIDKLSGRGYSDDDIGGMLGENMLRVFDAVWK
ncbi:MAG TPA: membrane dipeptidase [Trueperaceae bacterium]|nr:membrane dipeptidase [Trueperaceae bacterium]